ncbi:type VI secretion system-associated protein, partial [Burkholderia pseudomallei]|uniref:type VI secretion system contractile sheath small subunit n=1 Tax=Burkholderia pseudomallei TaxID=28450 RepID=UPI000CCDB3A6
MAKKESIQKRLQKVRPPRVQSTYEVERGHAIVINAVPVVVRVVGDLEGTSDIEEPKLRG